MGRRLIALCLVFALAALGGCGGEACSPTTGKTGRAHLRLVREGDAAPLLDRTVSFSPGGTVLELLEDNAVVGTGYGGGFVVSINGLTSVGGASPRDWFYKVNGKTAERGAAETTVRNGDRIEWQYRGWQPGETDAAR